MDNEMRKSLKTIQKELGEIRDRSTVTPRKAFTNGLIQALGWAVGTIIAVALIGWILTISGLVPGLNKIVPFIVQWSAWHAKY